MIKEGDIGCVFEVENVGIDNDEILEWKWLIKEKYVEYKNMDECFKEFDFVVGENKDEMVEKYVDFLKKMSEGIEGKWFVGGNGEYVVMLGIEFESEDESEVYLENEDILKSI